MKTSTSSNFFRKLFAPLCAAVLPAFLATSVNAQQSITTPGVAVTQSFDSLGSSATAALPSGWKMGTDWSTGATATAAAAGTSGTGALTSSSSGNFYNFANGVTASSTDRAIGFLTTGTYTSPRSIIYAFQNNTGQTITSITLSWNYEKYRTGTRAFDWTFFHGSTPTVTTAAADGNQSYTADAANAVVNPPTSLAKTVTLTGLNIAPGATYYLRWTYTGVGGSTNAQGLGVDDFSITLTASTNPGINTTGSLTPFSSESGTASAAQTFNATGANLTTDITVTAPTDFEVATDGATYGDTATITQSGGSASGTVSVRIKASATAGSKSGNVVLSSTGATSVNVPVTGTVTAVGVPLITLSTNNIIGLSTSTGSPSAATNYTVTGTNLGTTDVSVTPDSALLQVGTNGTDFTNSLNLTPAAGVVSNTIYLRVAATNVVTNYSATISHVSGSASNSLAVSGAITNLPPVLTVSTNTLSGFTTTTNAASAAQTFTVTGSNLTTNVTVGAPTGFEVANDGSTWGTNTSLTQASGNASGTISVRVAATNVAGTPAGNVAVTSGATNLNVAVSGIVTATANPFAQGNLVVARYGNGSSALGSTAATTAVLEVTPSGATNQVLTTLTSAPFLLTDAGSATSVGFLNTYQSNLALPGYNTAVGTAGVANLNTKAANIVGTAANVVGRVLFPTNGTSGTPLSPFSGSNFRSVIATSTNSFYAAGNSSGTPATGGLWYYDGTSFVQVSTNINNTRVVEIYNGKLYFSAASGAVFGIYQVGTALPTTSNEATLFIATGTGSSPYGFAISPDGNTAYIADDSSVAGGGGVQKWTNSGASWSKQYTFTNQVRGLAVDFSGTNPVIYATTTETANNRLIKITDTGSNSVATTIADAGANFVFRGVDFTPSASSPAPSNLSYSPSTTNAVVGTAIGSLTPSVTGTVTNYSVNPALPGGLSIDATTGVISGTPTTATPSASYTVTASNAGGNTTASVTIAVGKGTPVITVPPTASGLVQGQTLASSTLTGGSASVPGSFAWNDSGIAPPLGTTSYGVTFTATDAGNYNTAATTASVTVISTYQAGYNNWLTNYPSLTGANTNGTADPDSDGFNNSSEYAFGTSPIVPNGALLSTTTSNSVFRSSWAGPASGVTYGVFSTTNLATTAFTNDPTAPVLTNGNVLSFTNQATGNKFFRVRATSN